PDNDFVGTDAFTYTLEDSEGRKTATSVTVVVNQNLVTDKPLVLETTQGTPINAFIFDEYKIPAGYELSGKVNAKNGVAQVIDGKRGIVNYTPNEDFAGFEMFYVDLKKGTESRQIGVIVKVKAVQSLMEKYGISTNTLFINVNGRTIIDVRKFAYSKLTEEQMMIAIREAFDAAEMMDESQIGFSYVSLQKEQYAITYQVQDDEGRLFAGSIVIYPVDELGIPIVTRMVLVQDVEKTQMNAPITLLPMLNDRHLKGESMKIVNTTTPMNGTVVLNDKDGSILYIPNLDFHGTDAFTYTVQDESGVTSTSAVSVVVLNQLEYALEEKGYNPNLKAFDYVALSADERSFKPEKIVDATNGLFGMVEVVNAYTGELKYTPNPGSSGEDRFAFTMQHTDGATSTHSVLAVVDNRSEFIEGTRQIDGRVTLYSDEVMYHYGLFNKTHPEGKEMKIVSVQSERQGTTDIIDQTAFAYRPVDGFKGLDKVTFTVMDEDGNLQKNEVFIEVKNENARMDQSEVKFETPVNIPLDLSLKGNISNAVYHDHTSPEHGELKLKSAENLTFRYDAATVGDLEKFRIALKGSGRQMSYVDVIIEVKPALDMAIDAPTMGDFEYQVETDPTAKLLSASQGRKGEVKFDPMTGSISYLPYAAALGPDQVSFITKQEDGSIAQSKLQVLHADHAKFGSKQGHYVQSAVSSNAPVLIYAFSNMNAQDRGNLQIGKLKKADEGEVKILDAKRGIIEYTPKPGTSADEFSYRIEHLNGEKQEVIVALNIKESKAYDQQVLTITAAKNFKAFGYGVLDHLEQKKLKFMSVSDGGYAGSQVEVLDAESGVFTYETDAASGASDFLIVEAMDEEGNTVQIPVQVQVVDKNTYSGSNLTYNNISSVESNKDSYHTVLGRNEDGFSLVRASNAKAGKVSVLDAKQGIVRYSPYPGFVGEDSYVFEYADASGTIFQKEMKVVVRDPSAGMISISEIERQSQAIAVKVTNVSEDLAQAQQESIANLPEESSEEIQKAIAAQKAQQQIEIERRKAKRTEEARIAAVEAEKKAQAEQENSTAALDEQKAADAADQKQVELAMAEKQAAEEASRQARVAAQKQAEEKVRLKAEAEAEARSAEQLAANNTQSESDAGKADKVVFRNILFDFDKSDLRPLSLEELNKIYQFMLANPSYELQLDGHADWIGTVEYNLALSERRSKQAYEYLIQKGIPDERMVYQFYGEAIPVAPNANADGSDNPEGRQLNRRCEFEVKESGTAANITLKF
ncbi:MAG: tandem-95 repeat protein, partial [Cryomorphaceae bacterium]